MAASLFRNEFFWRGVRRGAGVPLIVLSASFLGFGALIRESNLELLHGLLSTVTGWALPGQVALVELYSVGAPLAIIALGVGLTNARLLPMTVTLMPYFNEAGTARWKLLIVSHWIAVTGWAEAMRSFPGMPAAGRYPFFVGMSLVLWGSCIAATGVGYFLAGLVPFHISLGLVFLNPIYFMLIFSSDLANRGRTLALVFGAIAGPLVHLLTAEWSLLIAGLAAGTLGFALRRRKS